MQRLAILGATGSIGLSTLDVVRRHPDRFSVTVLAAATSVDTMVALCREFRPKIAVMSDSSAAQRLRDALVDAEGIEIDSGEAALERAAGSADVDTVMAAIVGFSGLRSAVQAARSGKRLLLANKEALVSAGRVLMDAVQTGGGVVLPVDSEHNAMFQCLPTDGLGRPDMARVEKIVLTASGGPFRGRSRDSLHNVTPEQACAHPNWSMGRKISVDSATLVNKGLELAEACWLFSRMPDQIEVVIHPQSVIHSMIRYVDGSVLAQLGQPDMRTPIAYCLGWPERIEAGVAPLDIVGTGRLDFETPDLDAFPCLRHAYEAIVIPGGMCVFNAANEVAVAAFLAGELAFTQIDQCISEVLGGIDCIEPQTLADVEALDAEARVRATHFVHHLGHGS
jgi:1-deoxy-D-xylulose-5-phosphate reductoisomerase